ncbi:MAG: Trk system potassium transporter TrkA [Firmicutes bacterium]|nr:Trk system potassium transporter TrkA [Bacillota bacterium]
MKVAVVGAGKLGIAITQALLGGKNEVTVIDKDEELIGRIKERFDILTVNANAVETEVLKGIGISDYKLLVAATDNDELNMTVCKFAKDLGCQQAIARVRAPEHVAQREFLQKSMGIDFIINPDMACAREIFRTLTETYNLHGGRFASGGTVILECAADEISGLCGHKIRETAKLLSGVLIAGVSRNGKIIIPNGDTEILAGDVLFIIGFDKKIREIEKNIHKAKQYTGLRRVMIAGGGKTGYYLAKLLTEFGISVKIIEMDHARCEYLSQNLDDALVLNGDATDTNMLAEEDLGGMDAFVATTGFDEENLLLSLVAKQAGVKKIVTKISRNSYSQLTGQLGLDMIINPLEISAASILRFVEREGRVVFSQMIQGQAEFVEIVAEEGMPITQSTLAQLQLPEGVLIAAVRRSGSAIIPSGSTQIHPGDSVIILSLLSSTASLEALLNK